MNDADFYELEDPVEQLQYLLRYVDASLLRVMPHGIEVLPDADPIRAGRAITTFRAAAAHFGFESTVLYGDPIVVALRETCATDESLRELFPAIVKCHATHKRFAQEPLSPESVRRLCDLVDLYPETLSILPRRSAQSAAAQVVLTTDGDRVSLVKAGEVLGLVLLRVTLDGLGYSLLEVENGLLIRVGRLTAPVPDKTDRNDDEPDHESRASNGDAIRAAG